MGVKNRGFASASPERRKELAKKGSDAAKEKGGGHRFTSAEARTASVKGLAVRRQHRAERKSEPHDSGR